MKYLPRAALIAAASTALIQPLVSFAQSQADAGALQKQIEGQLKTTTSPQTGTTPRVSKDLGATRQDVASFEVSGFEFMGHTLLSNEELQAIVTPYMGQRLDIDQLKKIADIVGERYRDAGWMVRVFLPKQDITNGVVKLQIVEAKFGTTVLQGVQNRVTSAFLSSAIKNAQTSGEHISTRSIDRALLLLNDIPGLVVAGNLIQGQQAGETNLLLGVDNGPATVGNVSVDNYGSRSTGTERVLASLNINSPLQLGDQLGLTALKTQGSDYQRVGYTVPVGYDGLRAGIHATHLNYGLVGEFASLGAKGSSFSTGLDVSYPILRSQPTNLNLVAGYDQKRFDNNNASGSVSHYNIDVINLGINATQLDNWNGGGMNNASLTVTAGHVNLDGSANQSLDTQGPATAGNYTKLAMNLSRLQKLDTTLSAYVALNMQMASKNLDSSERLYLGGATGVRAYPSSEGGGSLGNTLTMELRKQLDSHYTVTGFYDRGHVQAFKNNAYADGSSSLNSGSFVNNYSLTGYGVSLAWQSLTGTELRATLAHRQGSNPIANTTTGNDGDGTLKLNRLWLNASVNF